MITVLDAISLVNREVQSDGSQTSFHTYKWHGENAEAYWGPRPLTDITRRDVQDWINQRRGEVSAATVAHEVSYLSRLYRTAWDHGHEVESPCVKLRKPRIANKRKRVMSLDEERRLGEVLPPRDFSIVQFAVHSSLRRLEIFRLEPADVEFFDQVQPDGSTLRVGSALIRESKTGKSRVCALNPIAAEIARAWIENEPGQFVFYSSSKAKKRITTAMTFTGKFIRHCKVLGIKGLRIHDLRHTAASRASENGAHVEDIQQLLGHETKQMTERYITRGPEPMWRAAMAICR